MVYQVASENKTKQPPEELDLPSEANMAIVCLEMTKVGSRMVTLHSAFANMRLAGSLQRSAWVNILFSIMVSHKLLERE